MSSKTLSFSEHSDLLDENDKVKETRLYPTLLKSKEVGWKEIAQLIETTIERVKSLAERSYQPLGSGKDKSYEEALKVMKLEENLSLINHSVPIQLMVKLFRSISMAEQFINGLAKRLSKKPLIRPLLKLNYEKPSISEVNINQLTEDYPFVRIKKCSELSSHPSSYEILQYLDGKFNRIKTPEYAWEIYLKNLYDALVQFDVYIKCAIFYVEIIKEPIAKNQTDASNIVSAIVLFAYLLKLLCEKLQLVREYSRTLHDLKLISVDGDKISKTLFKEYDADFYHRLLWVLGTDDFTKSIAQITI